MPEKFIDINSKEAVKDLFSNGSLYNFPLKFMDNFALTYQNL